MSRLVRLYPKAWRERYEVEFLALLDERPPTTRDVVDTVRGAIDARLHPHLTGGEPSPWTHRIPGLLALVGGVIWSSWIVSVAFLIDPDSEWGSLIGWSVILMFLSLPGDYMAAHGRRIAVAFGLIGASVVVAQVLGWPFGIVFLAAAYILAVGGILVLAAIRAEIGPSRRWMLLAPALGLPVAFLIPVGLGFVGNQREIFAIMLPYGLTWVLIGLRMTIRGAPTIVDPPEAAIEAVVSEVRPA